MARVFATRTPTSTAMIGRDQPPCARPGDREHDGQQRQAEQDDQPLEELRARQVPQRLAADRSIGARASGAPAPACRARRAGRRRRSCRARPSGAARSRWRRPRRPRGAAARRCRRRARPRSSRRAPRRSLRQSSSVPSSAAGSDAGVKSDLERIRRFSARIVACGSGIAYVFPATSKVTPTTSSVSPPRPTTGRSPTPRKG